MPEAAEPSPPPTREVPAPTPGLALLAAARAVRARIEDELAEHALGLRHLSVLGHLAHEPGLSFTELAHRAGITVQSMQATLLQLEANGAVKRGTAPGRGRKAQLHLTRDGGELLTAGMQCISRVEDQMLLGVSDSRRPVLIEVLLQVIANLSNHQEQDLSDAGPDGRNDN